MGKGVNRVFLIGNLGADPDIRYSQSGNAVCNVSIATTEGVKVDGEWTDKTEWHRVVAFGKTAENIGKYLAKGSSMYVEGRLQTRKWTDKEGQDKYTTEIVANQVQFLGGGKDRPQDRPSGGDQGFDPNGEQPF